MALLQKIRTISRRLVQLEGGTGNNQPARASDVNPVIQWVNDRSDINTVANAVTTTGTTAQVGTLNAISGTITSAALTVTAGQKTTFTITNAYCTANSTVVAVISDGSNIGAAGTVYVVSAAPAAGSFVITIANGVVLTGTPTVKIKFIIL